MAWCPPWRRTLALRAGSLDLAILASRPPHRPFDGDSPRTVVFRSSQQNLTTCGTYAEMVFRITEPVLLGLAVLAVHSRVKPVPRPLLRLSARRGGTRRRLVR
ncbi:hypothetical protein C3488_37985 [Streptomyces sp. Ru72]|nr:hypothetical protein C3488_37985 [Streptomyces sp. Ru72]